MARSYVTSLTVAPSQLLEERVFFTFAALCRASGAEESQMQALVAEGMLHPTGSGPEDWQFSGTSLPYARRALRLSRELHLSLHGAAIVLDLLNEIEFLKARR